MRTTCPRHGLTSSKCSLVVFLMLSTVMNYPTPAAALSPPNHDKKGFMNDNMKKSVQSERQLFDAAEHATAGENAILPFPEGQKLGTEETFQRNESNKVFYSFGQLTCLAGDFLGPYRNHNVICHHDEDYAMRHHAAEEMMKLFDDRHLGGKTRIDRANAAMKKERDAAHAQTEIFQKHVAVHSASYDELHTIDAWSPIMATANCNMFGGRNSYCMTKINFDHFGDCAKMTYQIFHDIALEQAEKGNLNDAYFYEGLGSHALTDLFSAGHIRVPSKKLRGDHCSEYRGGMATNQMHDEDSYNGLLMTNRIKSKTWWVYGDSFYFESCNDDNRMMMGTALQKSIDEVYNAFTSGDDTIGHTNVFSDYPGKGLDYIPDKEASEENVPNFWDANTCPMWHYNTTDQKMFRRFPWYRLRSSMGRNMTPAQPSRDKFGLLADQTFPLVGDAGQLRAFGTPDLKLGDCWFKESPETSVYSNECWQFGYFDWHADNMFYSREAAGFLPPTLATCQAFSKQGRFDNDCYDVLELVSKGQSCDDLKDNETCAMLEPRCRWADNWGPDAISGGTCVQGSCVAYSDAAGDIVPGDPTPPVPLPPEGFYMSFQGACAFNSLGTNGYTNMTGKGTSIEKCAELCLSWKSSNATCTGIAVDNGNFDECYLYFDESCKRADGPGFLRCPSHGLQTFHRGSKPAVDIIDECTCKKDWYYKDINHTYHNCTAVEAESWGKWCYVENPEECEIAMHSTTQPDEGWRYCGQSTCEDYSCPNGYERRDTVICYDDSCDVNDCCVIDTTATCDAFTSNRQACVDIGCVFIDGYFWDSCEEDDICESSEEKDSCENKGCAWQDGWTSNACKEGICENRYTQEDCEKWDCAWQDGYISDACKEGICENRYTQKNCEFWNCTWIDGWWSDYCQPSEGLEFDDAGSRGLVSRIDSVSALAEDSDFIDAMTSPLEYAGNASLSGLLQPKLSAMLEAMESMGKDAVLFFALDDGTCYGLKSCKHGPSCWSKHKNNSEHTLGVVQPDWSEFINVLNVASGTVDLSQNRYSEFGVPDFAVQEFNATMEAWYGEAGWSAPFTCTLMHPDESHICKVYAVVGSGYSFGVQTVSPEDWQEEEKEKEDDKNDEVKDDGTSDGTRTAAFNLVLLPAIFWCLTCIF